MFLHGDLGKMTSEQKELLEKAHERNSSAITIVGEFLLANKTEDTTGKKYSFGKIDMIELLDNVIFDFSGSAHSRGIEIMFLKPENKLPEARGDKEKLRIVLQNVLENAVKYSDDNEKIFVTVQKNNAKELEISVKDRGVGISENGRKKIFQKFYRDSEAQKKEVIGSGIGLFITKEIVKEHGGKIWFESDKNKDTTFSFTVPISK